MARSKDVQYVRFYSYGSEAQKVELPVREKKKITLPKSQIRHFQQKLLKMDALALTGIVVAGVLLLCMLVGFAQACHATAQMQEMTVYVANLEAENQRLQAEYEHGYDLAQVRIAAESMGLVLIDEVRHKAVDVPDLAAEEPAWWEQWIENLKTLFA